jgi:hypothetical protein
MTKPNRYNGSAPDHIESLGTRLAALAHSSDDSACLDVFARLLHLASDDTRPHLLTVLLKPDGRVQILTVGHACPGLTVQVGDDLQFSVPQLWFGGHEPDV